jgi:hypothetical protein
VVTNSTDTYLADTWLLVFDNADDYALIRDYWPTAGHGAVLVATRSTPNRQSVNFPNERNFHVETFGDGNIPRRNGPDQEAGDDTGAQFLLHMANRRHVVDGEVEAARWCAAELGGHALALTHFAGLINRRRCTIQSFADSYQNRYPSTVKAAAWRRRSKYGSTLDTIWELSFNSLGSDALSMLVVLSLLSGDMITKELFEVSEPNNLPAILSFCDDDLRCVQSLACLLTFLDKRLNTWHVRLSWRC